jgi:hypothetical protein
VVSSWQFRAIARFTIAFAIVIAVPLRASSAQTNWGRYKPGSISAIMEAHDPTLPRSSQKGRENVMVSGDDFPTIADVLYRGQSRPLTLRRAEVLREWSMTFMRDTSALNDFHREYLFQEGERLLWLPVQDTVASFFAKELKTGQPVYLYVIFLGAQWTNDDVVWGFAVNEFKARPMKP